MNVLVLEDEVYTLRYLEKLVSDHPFVNKVVGTSNSKEAIKISKEIMPDVVFLDIELSSEDPHNGIEAALIIKALGFNVQFVFITGYTDYALNSFNAHPYDYLLKPVSKQKIFNCLNELYEKTSEDKNLSASGTVIINIENERVLVSLDDILFIEKEGKQTLIHTLGQEYSINSSLNEVENMLPIRFIRTHKSYIINVQKINKLKELPSRSFEANFLDYNKVAYISRNKYSELKNRHFINL